MSLVAYWDDDNHIESGSAVDAVRSSGECPRCRSVVRVMASGRGFCDCPAGQEMWRFIALCERVGPWKT